MTKINLTIILTFVVLVCAVMTPVFAADRMTYEEYMAQLKVYQDREQKALAETATERQMIDDLKKQIEELNLQISNVWDQIFAALGITREDYEKFVAGNDQIGRDISALEQLSPDKLLDRVDQINQLGKDVAERQKHPGARISTEKERLADFATRIERLKNAVPKPKNDTYFVVRGDYLWKISGKKQVYSDPWKWMRIYSANRDQIKDPDLIHPDQRLLIPREIGKDQYLVRKGEYLSKIAGSKEVYGDPFQWTKIYQANKSNGFIQDPNLIYPEMILSIP